MAEGSFPMMICKAGMIIPMENSEKTTVSRLNSMLRTRYCRWGRMKPRTRLNGSTAQR